MLAQFGIIPYLCGETSCIDCDTLQLLTATELPSQTLFRKEMRLSILPNPVFESILITQEGDLKPLSGVLTFQIYSSLGQPIGDLIESGLPVRMTVKNLPKGMYFLQITDKNGRKIQNLKFVKQ